MKNQSAVKNGLQSLRKRFAPTLISKALKEIFTGWSRSAIKGAPTRAPLHRGFVLEALEPRLLLSADINYAAVATATGADYTLVANGATTVELRLTSDSSLVASAALDGTGVVNILRQGVDDATSAGLQAAAADTLRLDFNSLSALSGWGGSVLDINFTGGAQDIQQDHVIVQGDTSSSPLDYSVAIHADADIDLPALTKLDLAASKNVTLASEATRTGLVNRRDGRVPVTRPRALRRAPGIRVRPLP